MSEKRTVGPVTQSSATTGGVSGALSLIIVWALSEFAGLEVSTEVGMAIAVIVGYIGGLIGGWLVRPGTGKRVDDER